MWAVKHSVCAAVLTRLVLLLYGEWQDRTMQVKYTDVDYHVFTDAARYVTQGESPYERATYRYTPLLAWLLTPNIYLSSSFGKVVFILCDVITGYLIYCILTLRKCRHDTAHISSLIWLFNPLPMTVSSRGNAESIMSALVLLTIYCLMVKKTKTSAFCYALSVHVKIYPVTYAIPMYFILNGDFNMETQKIETDNKRKKRTNHQNFLMKIFWPNKFRLQFVFVSVLTFVISTWLAYYWYGFKAIQETYLYHITRKDIRHNFSVYFYMLYLTAQLDISSFLGILSFLPQLILLVVASLKYYEDIPFCCFVHTFIFVTFNKVCTSQVGILNDSDNKITVNKSNPFSSFV
ncbi:GPI alpha-1,4-mannosyltransferase I, catalytic subunit-like [Saccoglossus kowalevskii]|uniref:GPI alpha-1,4-mannosyltransferase I, catalytic subunit n=1 Tax=Saccoglossus kowalevskii TaxID=10224 RepID=A0ABM0GIV4_SACKO|nr:PREDICTED: GPI mannosyltransferase 1-like [Saccoglossus kowalevskii]